MASKKEVGSAAGLVAIALVVVHTLFPGSEIGSRAQEGPQGKTSRDQAKTSDSGESAPMEGPWLATRGFFNSPPSDSGPIVYETIRPLLLAKSLSDKERDEWRARMGQPKEGKSRSWAVVATVADPVHSRMQTFFDGQIQSIEKAVAVHGWEFAAQWLPWRDSPDASGGSIEDQRLERQLERQQEALPGILVFRRGIYPYEALFVFLVPETPTQGISGDAFHAALNLARALSSDQCGDRPCQTGLLAPTFSGSFESLTSLLLARDDRATMSNTVYGGSISSADKAKRFEDAFSRQTNGFKFRSGIAASSSYQDTFNKVLTYYNIDPGKAAYWLEDESGFAASFQQVKAHRVLRKDEAIPTYWFPRDISHLRSAYQEATQSSGSSDRSSAPKLDFTLKDPSQGEDSIPVFSETHTPVGQSAAISTITEEFRREGTQMVFILAANTLDALLLARFVRNESPNTRVLIGDADTLFIPAASQESLSGTLFLSTYPMFILGQEWLTRARDGGLGDADKHLIFPSASHQGLFNVAQFALAGIGANGAPNDGDCLYGYRQLQLPIPDEKDEHPGLWLLTLTHYGFLPLDWFQVSSDQWFATGGASICAPNGAALVKNAQGGPHAMEERFPPDSPSFGWYAAALGMSAVIIVVCFWRISTDYSFASEKWFPSVLGAALSLTASQWILLTPAWRMLAGIDHPPDGPSVFDRATLAVVAFSLAAPLLTLWITFRRSGARTLRDHYTLAMEKSAHPGRARYYSGIMIGLFLWICLEWAWANGGLLGAASQSALLFRMRAVQLFSDSSPALPLFVLSLVFCSGFSVYVLRYSEATQEGATGRPDPGLSDPSITAIDEWLTAPFGISQPAFRRRIAVCISLIAAGLLIVGTGMFAFESPQFNCALYIALSVVLFSLATACYDLVGAWSHLSDFMRRLEWERRESFERVTKDWPKRRLISFWQSVPETFFNAQLTSAAKDAGDILALQICRYLVYVVRQMQRIAWSIGVVLVMVIVVLTAYSVQAPQLVGRFVAVLFLIVGAIVVWVFANMEKNWVISQIDRTEPGDVSLEFVVQAAAAVAVPLVGVLVHLFPSIGGFVSSWLAPSLEALR